MVKQCARKGTYGFSPSKEEENINSRFVSEAILALGTPPRPRPVAAFCTLLISLRNATVFKYASICNCENDDGAYNTTNPSNCSEQSLDS
jgi:hypothetical protein